MTTENLKMSIVLLASIHFAFMLLLSSSSKENHNIQSTVSINLLG